jgi:hypothetical protein
MYLNHLNKSFFVLNFGTQPHWRASPDRFGLNWQYFFAQMHCIKIVGRRQNVATSVGTLAKKCFKNYLITLL